MAPLLVSCLLLLFRGAPTTTGAASPRQGDGGLAGRGGDAELAPEHFHRGNRLLHSGDYAGAEEAYRQAARISPWDGAFYINLASALMQAPGGSRVAEAEAASRTAVALQPYTAHAHYSLGQVFLQDGKGRQREGLRRLSRAVALDPANAELALSLGRAALAHGKTDVAIRNLHQAAALRPGHATSRDQLGYALSKAERLPEATAWLESAVERGSTHSAVAKLVEVLLWQEDEAEARRLARRAVDELGIWRHPMQRPTMLYRRDLLAKPVWSPDDAPQLRSLVDALSSRTLAEDLLQEVTAVQRQRPGGWRHQPERIQEPGVGRWKEWKVLDDRNNPCRRALFPVTCAALDELGQIVQLQWSEFSVLEPGAHIRPHTGPTNDRLTAHLCLSTPPGVQIRLSDSAPIEYTAGAVFLFDDSWEHEVWQRGDFDRVVLLVQFTHPGNPAPAEGGGPRINTRTDL